MSVPLIAIAIFLWMPETPFYLLKKGNKRKAYAALEWLRGQPGDSVVQKELDELQVRKFTCTFEYRQLVLVECLNMYLQVEYKEINEELQAQEFF